MICKAAESPFYVRKRHAIKAIKFMLKYCRDSAVCCKIIELNKEASCKIINTITDEY